MLRCWGSSYQEGGAAPRRAEQHILTPGEIGANLVYSYRVPSARGTAFIPPQPPLRSLPSAVDLQLAPSYQRSLQINATASTKTHSTLSECRGVGKKSICTCAGETRISTHLALLHLGCPCAEALNLPTYPYAGKENFPESQAWSDT